MKSKLYKLQINRIFWAVLFLMLITSGNVFSQWIIYDASVVPLENGAPTFTRSNTSVSSEIFDSWSTIVVDPDNADNNLMQFLDNATNQRGMWRSNLPSGTSKLTFIAKLKAYDYANLNWTMDIDFDFGGAREQFFIMNSDQIRVRRGTDTTHDLPVDFDLTNWNTFRFVFDNEADPKTFKVYLNESATPFIEATPASAGSNNYFRFGNGDNSKTVGFLMDWIIWDTTGAYAPGEGAAIPDPVVTPSWNADLAELKADAADIAGFGADVLTYEVVLPVGTTDVPVVTATASDPEASVLITPATEIPGSTTILVTAENGTTQKTYTVDFRIISDVATLDGISVDGAALTGFDPTVLTYEVILPLETTTDVPEVTAVATGPNADIVVTPATALPGQTTILVTAEDGIAKQTYTVNFVLVSIDATLSDISADAASIPGFDPAVFEYNLFYPVGTTAVPVITATASNAEATVAITQATAFPGTATIVVTAEDGATELTYTVNLLTGSSDATLANLLVAGAAIEGFAADVLEYFLVYPVGTTDVPVITAEATDANADVVITSATAIPGVTTIVVTAEDNFTVLTYTVNIRNISIDADLSDLLINGTTVEGFAPDVLSYDIELSAGTVDVPLVTAVAADENAEVVIDPATELPGTTTVVITAEDDTTKKTYTINFTVKEGPLAWRVYDASVLPDAHIPLFSESNVSGTGNNALVTDPDDAENSFLELITPAVGDNFMWRTPLQPETPGVTFVMKVKAANDQSRRVVELDIHHNGIRERMYINREENRLRLQHGIGGGDGGEIPAPEGVSLSDWNVYRITKSEGDIKLYLNEDPTPIAVGTTTQATTSQYFRFGDGNGSHNIAALIDWIIWDETGAYAPGEGSPIPTKVVTPNWDATITELLVDGTLIAGFAPDSTNYDIILPDGTTDIPVVSATISNPDAQMVVTQATELPGVATVTVTAVNGFTVNTYDVTLRFISSNAALAGIKLGTDSLAGFDTEVLVYDVVLPEGTTVAPEVSANAADANATVEITQADVLPGAATIKVTAEDGTTVETYTINFTIATNVWELTENSFRMYPNPANSTLNIEWSQNVQERVLQVINVNGQVVLHKQSSSNQEILDISLLEQGVYILQIKSEYGQARKLFIKQ
jgi:hypothetical protein